MENNTIILELLSAGVIAALITGIFSLVIAVKNNRRLIELENIKQKFTVNQERFKGLREAYNELIGLLPEETLLGHVIMNLPIKEDFQKNGLSEAYKIADNNMIIMYSHFQRYCYLLPDDEQKKVESEIEEIDITAKNIINLQTGLDIYNIDESSDIKDSLDTIQEKVIERIIKVTEFEDMYFKLFKENLSDLSKSSNQG